MSAVDELERLRHGDAVVDRSDRGFVRVTGPDAVSFLQALVSADLDAVADGEGAHSLLLTPQGKLDVDFRLLRAGGDAWLDCDPGLGAQLAASLNRFKIRMQADVVDRSGEDAMVSVVGMDANVDVPDAVDAHREIDGVRIVRTAWGHDLIAPDPDAARAPRGDGRAGRVPRRGASNGASRCSRTTWTTRRFRKRRSSNRMRCRSPRGASWARSSCVASTAAATSIASSAA